MRINKYLSLCGVASRRKCDEIIQKHEISINGKTVTEVGTKVNVDEDIVSYKGKEVTLPTQFSYYILNKPRGYITSIGDPQDRKTIEALLTDIEEKVFHVGRLDKESEGLLLLTNDGDLSHKLLHPKFEVPKKYLVEVNRFLTDDHIKKLSSGIELYEGITKKCHVELIKRSELKSTFHITITQGWNRQIRRMLERLTIKTLTLRRETFGTLKLNRLKSGDIRELTSGEILSLQKLVQ